MEKQKLRFKVNNDEYEVYIHPKTLLVEVIRDHLGFTGTKRGCETVSCGACTVNVNGASVKSCSVLAVQCEGMEVTTVEGLEKNGKLSPIQRVIPRPWLLSVRLLHPGHADVGKRFYSRGEKPDQRSDKREHRGQRLQMHRI